ncbi:MAG TPA: hypothetical protein VIC05_02465, partial [Solirubrobacteraceae bacterium]
NVAKVVWAPSGRGGGGSGGSGTGVGGSTGGGSGGGESPSAPATFTLDSSATEVHNVQGSQLTIDPSGMTADYHPPQTGAQWKTHYHWQVPTTLVAGKSSTGITIGETISEVQPDQELSDQINALAPDFAQAVQAHYHGSPSVEQSYGYTLAADTTQDFTITVGFVSSTVVYHYHRTN